MSARRPALLLVLLASSILPAQSPIVVAPNGSGWDGFGYYWGQLLVGQTFTPTVSGTIANFAFVTADSRGNTYFGDGMFTYVTQLMAWDNTTRLPVGPVLYESAPQTSVTNVDLYRNNPAPMIFNPFVDLAAGQTYIAILRALNRGAVDGSPDPCSHAYCFTPIITLGLATYGVGNFYWPNGGFGGGNFPETWTDAYTGGSFFAPRIVPNVGTILENEAWVDFRMDAAFTATFTAEPGTMALMSTGLLALAGFARRRSRRA